MAALWSALRQEINATVDDFREKGAIGALKDAALDAKDITTETGGWLWGGVKEFVAADDEQPAGQAGQETEAGAMQSLLHGLKQEVRETVQEFQDKGAVGALKDAALDAVVIAKSAGSMAVSGAKTIAFGEEGHANKDDTLIFVPPPGATAPASLPPLPTVPVQQSLSSQSTAPVVPNQPKPQSSSSSSTAPVAPNFPTPESSSSSSTVPLVPSSPEQPQQQQQPPPEGVAKQAEVGVEAAPTTQTEALAKPVFADKTESAVGEAKAEAERVAEKAEKEPTTPTAHSEEVSKAPEQAQVEETQTEKEQLPAESQKQDAQADEDTKAGEEKADETQGEEPETSAQPAVQEVAGQSGSWRSRRWFGWGSKGAAAADDKATSAAPAPAQETAQTEEEADDEIID